MKIYNSLSNKIEQFIPYNKDIVNMYVCGPTVYDHPHIGNMRPLVVFDLIYRFLLSQNYQVNYVSNYTDIDDKIIDKALSLNVDAKAVSEKFIVEYEKLKSSLNIKPYKSIKVTDTIESIIKYIEKLVSKDYAYVVDGDVYFRVNKVDDYGILSKQKLDDLMIGARIDENVKKESPLDFTLWKKTDIGENYLSPWSMGRPGWHTECVVMINESFNSNLIDIHGGGMDLKFPHHENEIAQARVCDTTHLAKYWIHNGLVSINDKKMSKSEGELILAKDMISDLGYDVVRWLLLSTHYRAPLKMSDDLIKQTQSELERIYNSLKSGYTYVALNDQFTDQFDSDVLEAFYTQLKDDFNTPNAYKVIFDTIKNINVSIRSKANYLTINKLVNSVVMMLDILGIKYNFIEISEEDQSNYQKWNHYKAIKDFTNADLYREKLVKKGII